MYFTLTHGTGEDPAHHMTTEYRDYKKAKRALAFLFDMYQEDLEKGKIKSFTCILKMKGVVNNGSTEKEKDQKDHKNK